MVGAEMEGEEEERAERRTEVGWRVHEAEGWHRARGPGEPSLPALLLSLPLREKGLEEHPPR